MKQLIYISEITFPSKSAYAVQVMKMCDAFSKKGYNVTLFVLNNLNKSLHNTYNCSSKFKIKSFGLTKNNFINRLKYCAKIYLNLRFKKSKKIFYSRSIITGLFLSFFFDKIIIEIHHPFKSFTLFLFNFFKFFKFLNKVKFVFISENLKRLFKLKQNSIVLEDAVDYENFEKLKKKNKIKNTCVYAGSFSKGKGLETIIEISKSLPNINFHIYGDFTNSIISREELKKLNNIIYKGYVSYKQIPKILNLYEVYLMPYSKKVYVRAKNLEVGKYMSPLKLYEYLASSGVLFASQMQAYNHILNNKNSVIIKNNSLKEWKNKLEQFFLNSSKFNYLSKNAKKLVKEKTWQKRVDRIEDFINVSI